MIHRRLLGFAIIIVSFILFVLSFYGPYAFVRHPTFLLAPIYAPKHTPTEKTSVRNVLERAIATEGTHAIYPKALIEKFYLESDNAIDIFSGSFIEKEDVLKLSQELGVERVGMTTIIKYSHGDTINVTLSIYDVESKQRVDSIRLKSSSFEEFLNGRGINGEKLDFAEKMNAQVPGMSISAWLYIIWLAFFAMMGLLLIILWLPRIVFEIMLGIGFILSLFSWIYALNGDMDYVQRFVATNGLLHIDDTKTERIATLVRFLVPMALLLLCWIFDAINRMRKSHARSLEVMAPLLAFASAVLYALSLPNILFLEGIAILAWIATAPLYIALRQVRYSRGIYLMMLFIGVQTLLINWWQGTFSYVSLPFTVGITLVQFIPFVLLLTLTVKFFPRVGLWTAPLLWTAFDWVRSMGFLGYPWGLLGVSQYSNVPIIQIASIGGVWMVSLLTHFSGAMTAQAIDQFLLNNRQGLGRFTLRVWIPIVSTTLVIAIVAIGGKISIMNAPTGGRKIRILLVQQNTDPRKHDYQLSFDELSRLTEETLSTAGPFDLVAWPEGGFSLDIRFWLDTKRVRRKRGRLVQSFLDWQNKTGIPLVTGTQDHYYEPSPTDSNANDIKRIQNSAVFLPKIRIDDRDRQYYHKIRLVPFTENFPFRKQFPWIAELLHNFNTTQWTPGTEHTVFDTSVFRFSTPICFEDVFPNHVRGFVNSGAEILVNISNDYWANTPLEGYQHAVHAIFRAVENRRPLVRATCSGWTISVDANGRIAPGSLDFYTPGTIVAEHHIPEEPHTTLYGRFGDWLPIFSIIIWIIALLTEGLKSKYHNKNAFLE